MGLEKKDKPAGKDGGGGKKKSDGGAVAVLLPQLIVLMVELHCHGCARKVKKSIKRAPGVESVTTDTAGNRVVVTGTADAAELKERIDARIKRPVQVISAGAGPYQKYKEKENFNDNNKAAAGGGDKKKEALAVEVVTTDTAEDKVAVTGGTADAAELNKRVEAMAKKPVQVVSPGCRWPKKDKEEKEKGKKADGGSGEMKAHKGKRGDDKIAADKPKAVHKAQEETVTVKIKGEVDATEIQIHFGGGKDGRSEDQKDKSTAASTSVAQSPSRLADAGMYPITPPQYSFTPYTSPCGGYYSVAPKSPVFNPHNTGGGQYQFYPCHVHAPQMFSEENPNICSVM